MIELNQKREEEEEDDGWSSEIGSVFYCKNNFIQKRIIFLKGTYAEEEEEEGSLKKHN